MRMLFTVVWQQLWVSKRLLLLLKNLPSNPSVENHPQRLLNQRKKGTFGRLLNKEPVAHRVCRFSFLDLPVTNPLFVNNFCCLHFQKLETIR
mmetsp:Transcript_20828/g.27426  ORF Transcript_20828/g.27426 Transcript_20828/m.27426 type:complete len:92 (-) Transcript_20828:206-481(-)